MRSLPASQLEQVLRLSHGRFRFKPGQASSRSAARHMRYTLEAAALAP